jgi:putative membrane protein
MISGGDRVSVISAVCLRSAAVIDEGSNSYGEATMHFVAWFFLVLQALIVVASLLGYGIFTSRPDLLVQVDPQARFFTWAFHGFAVGNMLFGGLAVVADALLKNRLAALYSLVAVYAVSLASELMGTGWGVPFGPYSYTSLLGPKWFELVPVLIPLSWFTMSWACWTMSRQHRSGVIAIMLATVLLVSWDLLLDPAMSKVTSYWVWGEAGSYYGMPWMNLFGTRWASSPMSTKGAIGALRLHRPRVGG